VACVSARKISFPQIDRPFDYSIQYGLSGIQRKVVYKLFEAYCSVWLLNWLPIFRTTVSVTNVKLSNPFYCCLSQWQKVCESIKNWFQWIYPNLFCLQYCVLLPCVYDFETSRVSGDLQPHSILYRFSVMVQKQFFRLLQLFSPEVKHLY